MITAIDTNLLLDILVPNEKFCDASVEALESAAVEGSLVVCDLVTLNFASTSPLKVTAIDFSTETRFGSTR